MVRNAPGLATTSISGRVSVVLLSLQRGLRRRGRKAAIRLAMLGDTFSEADETHGESTRCTDCSECLAAMRFEAFPSSVRALSWSPYATAPTAGI